MYISERQPTSVWDQTLARVESTILEEKENLKQSLQPKVANVDTAPVLMQRAARIREDIPGALMRIEQLLMFSLQLERQITKENFKIELQETKAQYVKLKMLTKDLFQLLVEQPDRLTPEEDLNNALQEMQVLSNAGSGERINEERIRIRSIERPVYPYGKTDAATILKPRYYATSMALNQLQAQIKTLENGHLFSLQFPGEMQNLLNEFEIRCRWQAAEEEKMPEQNTQTEEPADLVPAEDGAEQEKQENTETTSENVLV